MTSLLQLDILHLSQIKQESIETIKHQVDLVDVVSPYVRLKRVGRSWRGLSPFTGEKTPSFYVHPDRGFYKCFSSGEGGDCFTFIMKQENLNFVEAVEFLAGKFNITPEYEAGGPSKEALSLRKQLFDLHELTVTWFHEHLLESKEALPVRTYWKEQRDFSLETAKEIKIGYAPAAHNALPLYCKEKNISTAAMHQSGLFFEGRNRSKHEYFKSRFCGRLMIPIRDVQGRVVAFTGRLLEQTPETDPAREAKYINSPETPIFHKGRVLFGLDHARSHLKEGGHFLLVEGQLDAIRCWSLGLHTAVASQGTAITEEQLRLLRRYQPGRIECLLDGDSAGRKAALRILPLAFKSALEFCFLSLPEKTDPDNFFREKGVDGLEVLRRKAKNSIELTLCEFLPKDRIPTTHEKTTALQSVYKLLQNVPSEVAREDYINTAAKLIGVDPLSAQRDFNKISRSGAAFQPKYELSSKLDVPTQDSLLTRATWELLWLVLHHPEYSKKISKLIVYEWIDISTISGRLLSRLLADIQEQLIEDAGQVELIIETIEERQLLADIYARELSPEKPIQQIRSCFEHLRRNYIENQIKDLRQRSINADPETQVHLLREQKALQQDLKSPLNLGFSE